ncbi:MAG: HNH endonuclease [Candidatus Pacebacteria bacterium]|nr:HNH endonuclease [Candidatus Paceibacterota bacterium]
MSEAKRANPNRFGENASNWKNKRIICPDCGKRASYKAKKHCKECSLNHQKKENHPNWKNGISLVIGYVSQKARERIIKKLGNGGSHTIFEWENLKAQYNWTCLACKKTEPEIKLSQDHVIPISKGGSDNIENIQPLCRPCNSKKHTKITNYKI